MYIPETQGRQKLNTTIVKAITGGDPISAEAKYKDPFTFNPACKLWWAGNERPTVQDVGNAIWERIRLVPFERYFKEEERDPDLERKLRAEAPGILNWLLHGACIWLKEGLKDVPAKVRAAVEDYRKDEDTLADFIEGCTQKDPDARTPHKDVFRKYESWADEEGIHFKMTSRSLAKNLRARGWKDTRTSASKVAWVGIRIKDFD